MIDRITEQPFCQTRVSCSTFVNADCFDVFPFIEDKSIDAIICDLPYGTTACKWDSVLPFDKLWSEYERIIKPNGAIVLFGKEPFSSALIMSNVKDYKHKWVWNKKQSGSAINAKYMPLQLDEDIIVFAKGKVNYYPQMRKGKMRKRGGYKKSNNIMGKMQEGFENYSDEYFPTNIIEFTNPRSNKLHPTEKPIEIIQMLIKHYTNEGDMVLDSTMGSGTTNIACIKLNRKSIGIEKEKQYYDVAVRRASEYLGNDTYKNIQEKENYDKLLSSGMFWEFHPELSGNWDIDREVVQYCH